MKARLFLLLIIALFPNANVNAQWSWAHPSIHGNTVGCFSVTNDSTLLVGGENGCLTKSTDGGNTYTNIYSFTNKTIVSVAAPTTNVVYHVADNILYKSTNGGNYFSKHYLFVGGNVTSIYFITPDSGLVAQGNNILLTSNGGLTWTNIYSGFAYNFKQIHNLSNGFLFVESDGQAFLVSYDHGQNWATVNTNVVGTIEDIDIVNNNTGFICGDFGLQRSDDSGQTWFNISNLPTQMNGTTITSVKFKNLNTGVVCNNQGSLATTNNGGTSWQYIATLAPLPLAFVTSSNATNFICGGTNGESLVSNNNGTLFTSSQWKENISGLNAIDKANNNFLIACGNNGTIIKTTNGGVTWINLNSNSSEILNDIITINTNLAIAVGTNGTILRTIDGGMTWNSINSNTGEQLNSICKSTGSNLYIAGTNDIMLESNDNGITWNIITTPFTGIGINFKSVQYVNQDTGYYISDIAEMLTTYDGGINYLFAQLPNNGNITSFHFFDGLHGWYATTFGEIFRSIDAGNTWINCSPLNPTGSISSIKFSDLQNGWATSLEGMLRTADGGSTWNYEICPYTDLKDIIVLNGNNALAVGNGFSSILKRNHDLLISIAQDTLCTDHSYNVATNATNNFNQNNIFYLELSDELGSFDNSIVIGSIASTGNTFVLGSIPAGLTPSSNYQIRVLSTNPPMYSATSSGSLTIATSPDAFIAFNGSTAICDGDSVQLYALGSPLGNYQWYINSIPIVGATTDSLWASATGNYTVRIDNGTCDYLSSVVDVLVVICSGINEVENNKSIIAFPNPTQDITTLNFIGKEKFKNIKVYDGLNQELPSQSINYQQQFIVDLSNYPNGYYYLIIEGELQTYTKKIIKINTSK